MATIVYAHVRTIKNTTSDSFGEASTTGPLTQQTSTTLITRDADTKEWTSVGLESEYHPTWIGWRVHRVDTEVTISGNITFRAHALASVAGAGRIHWKLFKRTAGGSDVETLIAEADDDIDLPAVATACNRIATPPVPVTLAHNERLLYRIYVKRRSADFDTATFTLRYDHATTGVTRFDLTETVTFLPDNTVLIPRRTAVAGIGNFFDLLSIQGVTTATTGVVNTVASGTEIQWTRTAGGTVLEWISPRFKNSWAVAPSSFYGAVAGLTALESNLAANCAVRLKLFRWRAGVEALLLTTDDNVELGTTQSRMTIGGFTFLDTAMTFAEDDRLVARAYIINFGTMGGSRTCTIYYDHDVALANGDTSFSLLDIAEFKAEGDPGASPAPSGLATMGMGT